MNIFKRLFGTYSERELSKIIPIVKKIEKLDNTMQSLTDVQLQEKTIEFKSRLNSGETLDDILPEAFAVVRESSSRILGLKHYREQLIGGIVIHQGRISEMKTGEGKTLVATLPAYLNALTGKGVHIVTVNDYLATRDKDYAKELFDFLGLSVGAITHDMKAEARKLAYAADIIYGTNNEYGFDYLKDNMVINKQDKVQRKLNFAIIDEVDSILIDEARTPLIIAGKGDNAQELYVMADLFAKSLKKEKDFIVDEKTRSVTLTDTGISKVETFFSLDNYADLTNVGIQHNVIQALKANYTMHKDIDYMISNGEVIIVDEFTGRAMEGRRFSDGLHQAIEAKEMLTINPESRTLATITFQNYFRIYPKISGMTGTAETEQEEFRKIYNLDVIIIPTHKPICRIDHEDEIYKTRSGKLNAIIKEIEITYKTGQPILVGTSSIEKSEELSELLKGKNIPHQVLNAKYHEIEALIIGDAGKKGAITIATNMAGRGTDIKLGEGVKELGGLKIIGTERNDSRRVDNQLRGRAGRQGDVGSSKFFIALEDDLMRIFGQSTLDKIASTLDEEKPIKNKVISMAVEKAQKSIEGNNFDSRKSVLEYDNVLSKQREIIYNQRNDVLNGINLQEQIQMMLKDVVMSAENILKSPENDNNKKDKNKRIVELVKFFEQTFIPQGLINVTELQSLSDEEIMENLITVISNEYLKKETQLGSDNLRKVERLILLNVVDNYWVQHVDNMEHLKQGIGLYAYKQQDPVQAYQLKGSQMFNEMIDKVKLSTVKHLFNCR